MEPKVRQKANKKQEEAPCVRRQMSFLICEVLVSQNLLKLSRIQTDTGPTCYSDHFCIETCYAQSRI